MDEVGKAVAKTDTVLFPTLNKHLHYEFGHPLELVATLQEMTKDPSKQNLKYPFIGLLTDIPVDKDVVGFYGTGKFTIIIATLSLNTYKAKERLVKNFKPILQPIKVELERQLNLLPQFTTEEGIKYTEIEHYYWGKQGLYGNQGNIFNDWVDCIELRDIQVNILNPICTTLKASI